MDNVKFSKEVMKNVNELLQVVKDNLVETLVNSVKSGKVNLDRVQLQNLVNYLQTSVDASGSKFDPVFKRMLNNLYLELGTTQKKKK
jgi:hypothetical protein